MKFNIRKFLAAPFTVLGGFILVIGWWIGYGFEKTHVLVEMVSLGKALIGDYDVRDIDSEDTEC